MTKVKIINWREGFQKISFTKLIMEYSGFSLSEAKTITDVVLENGVENDVIIEFDSHDKAIEFMIKANFFGVDSELMD